MRILVDECLNPRIREAFVGHEVATVREMGWGGTTNGKLLALAQEAQFEVFVTFDQNLPHQQNMQKLSLGILVVVAADNNMRFLRPLFAELLSAAEGLTAGQVRLVGE